MAKTTDSQFQLSDKKLEVTLMMHHWLQKDQLLGQVIVNSYFLFQKYSRILTGIDGRAFHSGQNTFLIHLNWCFIGFFWVKVNLWPPLDKRSETAQ